jgi:hypothetical protein
MTMARNARTKERIFRDTPPKTKASDVPNKTGIVDAGQDQGRAAISHFFIDGTFSTISSVVMITGFITEVPGEINPRSK